MESQRTFLLIGLMLVSFLLFQEWNNDYNAPKADPSATTQTLGATTPESDDFIPASSDGEVPAVTTAKRSVIDVTTDVFTVKIDTRGGDIIETDLLQYEEEKGSGTPPAKKYGPWLLVAHHALTNSMQTYRASLAQKM